MQNASKSHSYVCTLDVNAFERLRGLLEKRGWRFRDAPHAHWRAENDQTVVIAYRSGKLVVQGRGTEEFVRYLLEPEITGEARYGYEDVRAEIERPEMFEPHIGVDESGKGDYFGPLVTAAVYVDGASARALLKQGVMDSKKIRSDRRITAMASDIRRTVEGRFALVAIGPEAYNRLYERMKNVNRLLAWAHARSIENVLEKVPACPRAVSDQFGREELVQKALLERGRNIRLEQYPRAETDVAVAAASVLARAEFVRRIERLSKKFGVALPKGAGSNVVEAARELTAKHGPEVLRRAAKLHFKTTERVLQP